MTLHFSNDVVDDNELTRKSIIMYVIIASLKSKSTFKLINRISGLYLYTPHKLMFVVGILFSFHIVHPCVRSSVSPCVCASVRNDLFP